MLVSVTVAVAVPVPVPIQQPQGHCPLKPNSTSLVPRNITNCINIIGSPLLPPLTKATQLAAGCMLAAALMAWPLVAAAEEEPETLSNVPQMLSGQCESVKDCGKPRIQRPKSRKAESCTIKCVTTCIRGGDGSPGEGPLNIRRPLVVFKEGFRSRRYCLVECSDICNLIGDEDYGP